jgi:hypothetical protein
MTQSDKDFITRIQVSQLVTLDPYEEDFYAQIYGQIMRSRMGIQGEDTRVLNFGPNGGVGLGVAQRPGGRRPGAMHKMEAQVEKIVQAARLREKEKGASRESRSLVAMMALLMFSLCSGEQSARRSRQDGGAELQGSTPPAAAGQRRQG